MGNGKRPLGLCFGVPLVREKDRRVLLVLLNVVLGYGAGSSADCCAKGAPDSKNVLFCVITV